ncbi:MAG: hypothetical protein ACK5Y2_02970 [Bdellovibrionales bacterium]
MNHRSHRLYLSVAFLILASFRTEASPALNYQGRLLHSDGTPVIATSVQFRLQIRTPGAENCLMYEQLQTANLAATRGAFSLGINSGSGTRTDSSGLSFSQLFSNSSTFTFPAGTCASGTTYTPTATDGRVLQAFFDDGTTGGWEPIPAQAINYVPMSMESQQVAGFPASSLVRVANGSGPQSVTPLSPADFTELINLLNGTSSQYTRSTASGASLPSFGAAPGAPSAGQIWFNSTSRRLEFHDGIGVQSLGLGSAVDGSAITSGTIGGTTAWNTSGNITTSGNLQATNVSASLVGANTVRVFKAGNANHVSLSAPTGLSTNYNLVLPTTAGTSGQVLSTDGAGGLSWVGNGTLTSVSSTNSYLTIANPTTSPAFTLNVGTATNTVAAGDDARIIGALQTSVYNTQVAPAAACTSSQTPYWNSVTSTWACQNIAGFVTTTSGFANGGNNFGSAASLGTNDNNNLSFRTNNTTQMTVLSNGNVGIGTTTPATGLEVSTNSSAFPRGVMSSQYSSDTAAALFLGRKARGTQAAPSAVQAYDTLYSFGAVGYGATGFSSSQRARVAFFASQGWTDSAQGTHITFDTTANNTALQTERMRIDQNGNVGIGTTAPSSLLDLNGALTQGGMAAPAVSAAGQGRLYFDSTTNKFRVSENGGAFTDLITSSSNLFANGGNSFGSAASLGTNDNNNLSFRTNNTTQVTILNTGDVGIGTAAPNATLQVNGTITGKPAVKNSTTTINFSTGNLQYTTSSCGAFTIRNAKDGASYTFAVQGTSVATCSFVAFSDAGSTPLTVRLPPGHGATTSGKQTLYSFLVMGSQLYVSWVPGY